MKQNTKWLWASLTVSSLIAFSPIAVAKPKAAGNPESQNSLQQRLQELEQNQKDLESRWQTAQEKEKDKSKESLNAGFNSKEGFYLKSADSGVSLRLKALVQADGRFFLNDDGDRLNNQFIARRVRPILEGELGKYFSFKVMPDFGGGNTVLQDAYADIKPFKEFKIRVGKFKGPVGLERLQSGGNLLSIERGLPTNLVPNRDLGVQVFGDFADGVVSYAVGLFNGTVDGGSSDTDLSDGKDVEGRIFAQPFKKTRLSALQKLGVGVGASYGSQFGTPTSTNLAAQRSIGQNTFFSFRSDGTAPNTVVANGDRWRIAPQGYYYVGPFGLFGEFVLSNQRVNLAGNLKEVENKAWQIASSYVLTGEENSFNGFKVKNPVNFKSGNWGALEIGARYNELDIDDSVFPVFANPNSAATHARAFGGVLNWHLTQNYKFSVSYDYTRFKGGAAAGGNRDAEHALFTRLQVAY